MKTFKHDLPSVSVDGSSSTENWLMMISSLPTWQIKELLKEAITKKAKTIPRKQAQRSAAVVGIILGIKNDLIREKLLDCLCEVL